MSFFAILLALLVEQARPLARSSPIHGLLRNWSRTVCKYFDAGRASHGWLAWGMAVLLPAALVFAVHWLLAGVNFLLAFAWHALVLYFTLGFRQFSHHFTAIRDALDAGDDAQARELLAQWKQVDTSELPKTELLRHVIEYSVLAAHRHVFGTLAWYAVLSALGLGPAGAVLYRMSEFVARYWRYIGGQNISASQILKPSRHYSGLASVAAQSVAKKLWHLVDYVPSRLTACCFAVVGSFEDAVDAWRNYANQFPDDNDGVIIAATAGATGLRLGGEALQSTLMPSSANAEADTDSEDSISIPGREPEYAHLAQVVGLVWRSVVLWMVLLALLSLAHLLG
jgi:adenosylcobinamide-phosphate synthase